MFPLPLLLTLMLKAFVSAPCQPALVYVICRQLDWCCCKQLDLRKKMSTILNSIAYLKSNIVLWKRELHRNIQVKKKRKWHEAKYTEKGSRSCMQTLQNTYHNRSWLHLCILSRHVFYQCSWHPHSFLNLVVLMFCWGSLADSSS